MQQFLQFIILTFIYSSTCFGRPHAHHQELNNCSSSLWFYLRSVVITVQLVVVGPDNRSDHDDEGRSESKERFAIQRYLLIIGKKQNMQVLSHTFTYFSTQSPWTLRHLYRDTSLLIPSSYRTAAWLFNQSMTACCRSSSSVNRLPARCSFIFEKR